VNWMFWQDTYIYSSFFTSCTSHVTFVKI
jgi:hypothetical protein